MAPGVAEKNKKAGVCYAVTSADAVMVGSGTRADELSL